MWAGTLAQAVLMVLWKLLPRGYQGDVVKLLVYAVALAAAGFSAWRGMLPRTRPIVAGEMIVAD
ncbi:MAG TPA: hypothetical protein VEF06_11255 [Bryobacteraceae bacterium]|nr:hypothetical protein [Bryobacteraceae bacterium]